MSSEHLRIAVLVSGHGRGTNLQALIDGCASGRISGEISLVIGTRSDAPALDRARAAGVTVTVISPKRFEGDDSAYGQALLESLKSREIGLICLAGYMRILPLEIVRAFRNRVLNVHPALLPKFGGKGMYGMNVHEAVLASGDSESGATVHLVDEQYDTGPIVVQERVRVEPNDTSETLAARVLAAEHRAYLEAIRLYAEGWVRVEGGRVSILGEPADAKGHA